MERLIRNALLLNHISKINQIIEVNRVLLLALQLEHEDVMQELTLDALLAIEHFDNSQNESLELYLDRKLSASLRRVRQQAKPAPGTESYCPRRDMRCGW